MITEVAEAPGTGHSYVHWVMECFAEMAVAQQVSLEKMPAEHGTERA